MKDRDEPRGPEYVPTFDIVGTEQKAGASYTSTSAGWSSPDLFGVTSQEIHHYSSWNDPKGDPNGAPQRPNGNYTPTEKWSDNDWGKGQK